MNGSVVGPVNVFAAGRLGGNGSVGNTIVQGTLAPGNSIGTLTVNGNLQQDASAVYEVEIDAAGASDRTVVNGTATVGGAVRVISA